MNSTLISCLSVPGKTFLVGEYLALSGGPSLVLATGPRFELQLHKTKEVPGGLSPFAAGSPAGRFLAQYPESFADLQIDFLDPHVGKGGLGASSAQFALLYAYHRDVRQIVPEGFNWRQLLQAYHQAAWSGEGVAPSGADVVAQLSGQVTWYDGREMRAKTLGWQFPNLSFTLVRTGKKLATHDHLKVTSAGPEAIPQEKLRQAVAQATEAFAVQNESLLVSAVVQAAQALEGAGLSAPTTLELLKSIRSQRELVLAAKGCGALGADVILLVHERARGEELSAWLRGQGLETCGAQRDLMDGLRFESKSS